MPDGQTQTGLGNKKISDLVDGVVFWQDGDTIKASGKLKTISEPWVEFNNVNNVGHFIPIKLPEKCKNKQIICKGRLDGDRTITIDDDLLLIQRLENLSGTLLTLEMDSQTLAKIDFSELIPVGEDAYDKTKTDFGGFGRMDDYVKDLSIAWDDNKGTATGILKDYQGTSDKNKGKGNFFPFSSSDWFSGVDHYCYIKNKKKITDKDVIVSVTDVKGPIKVEYNGKTVVELDISKMKMEPFVGQDAISIPKQTTNMDAVDQASLLIHTNVKITWEGIKGKVTGKVHKYKMENNHFNNAEGHYLPIIITGHDDKEITATGSDGTSTQKKVDPKWIIKVDGFKETGKPAKFADGDLQLAELDLSGLVLEP